MKLDYRLALDLGTNSIGWCIYRADRVAEARADTERWQITGIQRMGVRIFSDGRDPKSLASLAADRRLARQQRRRRDRALKRKQRLIELLIRHGLLPQDPVERRALVSRDPYELRARALDEPMSPHEIGRAIFHLARKRGFRSGRKDLSDNDKESGKIRTGIENLKQRIREAGSRTVGEYLAGVHARREPVLARPNTKGDYPIYLARELVAEEFDLIWAAQSRHSPTCFPELARVQIRDVLLFQRKLRPVAPGRCLLEQDQPRALSAHPLSQRFRVLQELANLRIVWSEFDTRALTVPQRDQLAHILTYGGPQLRDGGRTLTWAELRKIVGAPKGAPINLDTSGRKGLKADHVSIAMAEPGAIGPEWYAWNVTDQSRLLEVLRSVDRAEELPQALLDAGFAMPSERLATLFRIAGKMPDDFGSLSLAALQKIVPQLEQGLTHYDEAVRRAGYRSHSDFYDAELHPRLPYYGECLQGYVQPRDLPGASDEERRWGRIANPTVHVGLNQLRRVVNAIIRRYGHPREIIVEVARELGLSGENRRELDKKQRENRERNDRHAAELARMGQKNSRENRQRLQLYEELAAKEPLGAVCIYSGERIGIERLFSDEVEIDHILPFSRSLDDGIGNKVLCLRHANRAKRELTPHEAFGHSPKGFDWASILDRAGRLLPPNKRKRFAEDALEDFLKDRDFLDRHLTDTAYFSRVAKQYLSAICPPNCIWVSTGKMTAMLRGRWGLNAVLSGSGSKDRNDHRHHAVDAAVIGACDRALIQRIATAAARAEREGEHRLLERIDPPWPGFFDEVKSTVGKIVVSHKPEHGLGGSLHNDTNYGLASPPGKKGKSLVLRRVALSNLKDKDLDNLADQSELAKRLRAMFDTYSGTALKQAIERFGAENGIRKARITERLKVQPISNPHREQPRYVKTDGNHCYIIQRRKKGGWQGFALSRFEAQRIANRNTGRIPRFPDEVMRLHVDDCVAVELESGAPSLCRVVKLSDGKIVLAEHFAAGSLKKRNSDPSDTFKYLTLAHSSLYEAKARVVGVDELGYVNDPGFRP